MPKAICIACGGKGVSSSNRRCIPCNGTGYKVVKKPNPTTRKR